MPTSPLGHAKKGISLLLRRMVDGRIYKLYAPQSPPADPSARPQVAICDLISNLGDKVMAFPLLDAIREQNPSAEISYFTSGAGKIVGLHPAVDHLYVMDRSAVERSRFNPLASILAILRWWRRELRTLRFDTVVVLRGGVDPFHSHHLAWLLGGHTRVAYSTLLEPELPEVQFHVSPLFTAEVASMTGIHEVTRGSEVLQLAGLLNKPVELRQPVKSLTNLAQLPAARQYLSEVGLLDRSYAVVSPGASMPRRVWAAKDFAELARREFLPRRWFPVLVGGPELTAISKEILAGLDGNGLDLTGKTGFEQLVAVCGHAKCFVGNDSGPAHVAGACGVPTLIATAFASASRVSHHASPARSHPLGPWVVVVQPEAQLAPCTTWCVSDREHCIAQVSVEQMQQALQSLLARRDALPTMQGINYYSGSAQ